MNRPDLPFPDALRPDATPAPHPLLARSPATSAPGAARGAAGIRRWRRASRTPRRSRSATTGAPSSPTRPAPGCSTPTGTRCGPRPGDRMVADAAGGRTEALITQPTGVAEILSGHALDGPSTSPPSRCRSPTAKTGRRHPPPLRADGPRHARIRPRPRRGRPAAPAPPVRPTAQRGRRPGDSVAVALPERRLTAGPLGRCNGSQENRSTAPMSLPSYPDASYPDSPPASTTPTAGRRPADERLRGRGPRARPPRLPVLLDHRRRTAARPAR